MHVLAYLRASTIEQADSGAGVAAQRAAITAEADRRGWSVEFVQETASGKSMRRPVLVDALARLKAREVEGLVVWKMDRLSRSLLDFCPIMQRAQREGWALVALDSPADLSTPSVEAMAGVMAVFAQLERRLISKRTNAALAQRKAAGVRLGRAREIDPATEAQIVQLKAQGLSFGRIAATLSDAGVASPGGGPWQPSTLHRVLARAA